MDPTEGKTDKRGRSRGLAIGLTVVALVAAGVGLVIERPEASAPTRASTSSRTLAVRTIVAEPEVFTPSLAATGTLRPNEQVVLVSELTRRLVRIHANEGAAVNKGQILFELDDDDLLARRGRLRSQRGLANRTLERDDDLVKTGILSTEVLDQSRTRMDDARAQADENEVMLAKTRIRAPFSGTLGIRQVSEGAWVGPTVPLTSLYDTTRLKLDFRVPERFAERVAVGQEFGFRVAGSPTAHVGKIIVIEPQVEAATRSLLVRGLVPEPKGLWPGQFATVTITAAPARALFVPSFAVVPSERGHALFVERDGKAHRVEVELGHRTPERVEILSGLSPGDRVIVTNLLRLRDGIEVDASPYTTVAAASGGMDGAAP